MSTQTLSEIKPNLEQAKMSEDTNTMGDTLRVAELVKSVFLKVQKVLETRNSELLNKEALMETMKRLLTKAYMLDITFNALPNDRVGSFGIFSLGEKEEGENSLYDYTPSIGVFLDGIPVFLSQNYVEALGADDLETLKKEIKDGTYLDRYYTKKSAIKARDFLADLKDGGSYAELILETETGNKISWNSFGSSNGTNGVEIRLGNDITHGVKKGTDTNDISLSQYNGITLDTQKEIQDFANQVSSILDENDFKNLAIFYHLSAILDRVWNDGQHIINTTEINLDGTSKMGEFNTRYARALKRNKNEIIQMSEAGNLWTETYDEKTMFLISGLMETLKNDGYYKESFGMLDRERVKKWFNWFRALIKDKEFGINATFGIGNNTVSEEDNLLNSILLNLPAGN
ncbi:MAG: hypothetical protein PHE25_02355 [Candidatus Gracilibacteria bacterium]|nr:hypothetical protein [Candidatus Gracilibacteria bacterium]